MMSGAYVTVLLCLGALMCPGVMSETCITCRQDTLEECTNGKKAAEYEGYTQECSNLLPYCEVTVQEILGAPGTDEEPELEEISRSCIKESRFACSTAGNVRSCTATCQGDLCNDFNDVAARVERHNKEVAEQQPEWVIPVVAVGASLAVILLVAMAIRVFRVRANRRKTHLRGP